MGRLCALFGVSKQAYYKHDESRELQKVAQEAFVVEYIKGVRRKDPGIGGLKLWHMYCRDFNGNNPVGRDRFADIIDRNGLKIRRKIRRPRTTDSTHGLPTYPNIVKYLIPSRQNQLWVSDITYIPYWTDDRHYVFCYLSMILDAYTEEIIGWSVGPTLETTYPIEALKMALERLRGVRDINLIHHSDRGCQYASSEYIRLLKDRHIRISMTECGDPKENAQAERINNTMKNELLKDIRFTSIDGVILAVRAAVDFYNTERPHMSVDMMTPAQAAACKGELNRCWVSYRIKAIKEKERSNGIAENSLTLPAVQGSPSGLRPPVNP